MTTSTLHDLPDASLLLLSSKGDNAAYEQLVARHQDAVCGVAYAMAGDLPLSEEVAQDAFVTAWKSLQDLREPNKFRAWICGIARNLARKAIHRKQRSKDIEMGVEAPNALKAPEEVVVSQEEETIVWDALEALPENYREPLVLYYRNGESVAEVAQALDITDDAVKQRLSRGRDLLRHQVSNLVVGILEKSVPGTAFTVGVMSALPALFPTSATAATAVVGAKGVATKAGLSAAATTGVIGGILGGFLGLFGGWLGFRIPAETARYPRERELLLRRGRWMFGFLFLFEAILVGVLLWQGAWFREHPKVMTGVVIGSVLGIVVVSLIFGLTLNAKVKRVRAEEEAAGTPPRDQPKWANALGDLHDGPREYRSKRTLFGYPLIHIVFGEDIKKPAIGWLAIGTRAHGILVGVGSLATGLIAIGAIGAGLFTFAGAGVGVLAFAGFAVALWSMGGIALGWESFGGFAVGKNAIGGVAVGKDHAFGGVAISPQHAIGAVSNGEEAPRAVMDTALESSLFLQTATWLTTHPVIMALVSLAPVVVMLAVFAWAHRKCEAEIGTP